MLLKMQHDSESQIFSLSEDRFSTLVYISHDKDSRHRSIQLKNMVLQIPNQKPEATEVEQNNNKNVK